MGEVIIKFNGFEENLKEDFIKVLDILRKYNVDATIYFGKPEDISKTHIIVWSGENIIPEEVELELLKCGKRILVW